MPTVRVPAEFFRAELRMYGDWREAFARELLQNAFDARSTRVEIVLSQDGDRARVEFSDDGCGMSRSVLENVFFALGATTKTGSDTIGGFGRARIITCFAQESYTIETGVLHVAGAGGSYELRTGSQHRAGCRFDIMTVEPDVDRLRRAFKSVLRTCTPKASVYIDGVLADTYLRPERAVRVLRDVDGAPWAKVYVRRDSVGQLLVRTGGMTMFAKYLSGVDDVVVELPAGRSRELLAASRDRLVAGYDRLLDRFVEDVTVNRASALRERTQEPLSVHVRGSGFFFSGVPAQRVDQHAASSADVRSENTGTVAVSHVSSQVSTLAAGNLLSSGRATSLPAATVASAGHVENVDWSGFDVFLSAEANDVRTRRMLRRYDVRNWTRRSRRSQLLAAWHAALTVAVDALLARVPSLGGVMWAVGWVFDESVEASHHMCGDVHVFSLNPIPAGRRSQLGFSSAADRRHLVALAAHEVCHVVAGSHNESFAALLTGLYAEIDPGVAQRVVRHAVR
jgi:hypothetical protein